VSPNEAAIVQDTVQEIGSVDAIALNEEDHDKKAKDTHQKPAVNH
jgi:hypothetical protein